MDSELNLIAIVQLVVTWMLVGIVWFSQVVHYPLYKKIKEGFVEYERSHIRRVALLKGPLMLLEAITAILLIGMASEGVLAKLAGANLILLILVWLSTFIFQISQHQKLSVRFSNHILRGLIRSNWARTILWTAKGCIMAAFLYILF